MSFEVLINEMVSCLPQLCFGCECSPGPSSHSICTWGETWSSSSSRCFAFRRPDQDT